MNHWTFCNAELAQARDIRVEAGTVSYYTAASPDKSTANEDSFAIIDFNRETCVLCVADGAGGYINGNIASQIAVETIVECVVSRTDGDLDKRLAAGFELAQTRIIQKCYGGGTTLIVAVCSATGVTSYVVGDSCLCIAGGRGRTKSITVAQSPTGYAVDRGVLDVDDALHHPERHLVSGLLGLETITVDMRRSESLAPRDTVVIASDGLYDNLYVKEITKLASGKPQISRCEALVGACRERMLQKHPKQPSKPDDLTVLLFRARNQYKESS